MTEFDLTDQQIRNGPRRFFQLLSIGFCVTLILGVAAVAWVSRSMLDEATEEFRDLETQSAVEWYNLQILTLRRSLNYLAHRPEIVSAVLGETRDMRAAVAVLETQAFNPYVQSIHVFDLFGDQIAEAQLTNERSRPVPAGTFQRLVNQQLLTTAPQAEVVNTQDGGRIVMSWAVRHQGSREGVVVAVAALGAFESRSQGVSMIKVSEADTVPMGAATRVAPLRWNDLKLIVLFDPNMLESTWRTIMTGIASALAAGLAVSFVSIGLIGQSMLVAPYRLVAASRERLQESELRSRELADVAALVNDAIMITDPRRRVIWSNAAATRITGYYGEELTGQNPGELLAGPETDRETQKRIAEAVARGLPIKAEIVNYTKSGKPYWSELAITPDYMPDGSVRRFIAVERDITTTREREDALRAAMARANAASEAKSMFLANMSHEIRTPMNGILGMVDVLDDSDLDQTQRETMGVIRRSAEALVSIINDILDFSRIEAGHVDLDPVECSVEDLVHEVLLLLKTSPYRQETRIYTHVAADVPTRIVCDKSRLRQVLLNVVGNALKFTAQGWVRVTVSCDAGVVRISVRDTGCGISEDRIGSVFDAFEQANNTRTRSFDGTGLGLAISSKLITLMGGTLSVTSTEGVGSEFTISLPVGSAQEVPQGSALAGRSVQISISDPLLEAEVKLRCERLGLRVVDHGGDLLLADVTGVADGLPVLRCTNDGSELSANTFDFPAPQDVFERRIADLLALSSQSTAKAISTPEVHLGPMHVLLVDDNDVNRLLVRKMLATFDLTITEASNGQEAVDRYLEGPVDLVLMDMAMPVMSGETATREIRAIEQRDGRAPVPVLALTANASAADRELCRSAGMNDFLTKPLRKATLLQAMADWASKGDHLTPSDPSVS